jgi:hypothetical protein
MSNTRAQRSKALGAAKNVRAAEAAEDAAEKRATERAEDREESAKAKARTDAKVKSQPEAEPAPFNPPRIEYPRWIKADIPDVGEASVVVQSEAQEAAVKAKTATYKLSKSANGDSYEIA